MLDQAVEGSLRMGNALAAHLSCRRDMRGAVVVGGCAPQVDLADRDLSATAWSFVDLHSAMLDGATLVDAHFEFVDLRMACLRGVMARGCHWQSSDLTGADLTGADLRDATLRGCIVDRATFMDARLEGARLVSCRFSGSTFAGADLGGVSSIGCSYRAVSFEAAMNFANCREVMAEVLRRELTGDAGLTASVGAVLMARDWCWPEWARYLDERPRERSWAISALSRYPRSGALAALCAAMGGS